jgi:predicted DNA binding CopG/RHH family protein
VNWRGSWKKYGSAAKQASAGAGPAESVVPPFTVRGKLIRVISVLDMKKRVPEFRTEEQEREFWATQDSTRYIDWSQAKRRKLPDLKPSLRSISLRLPVSMIEDLKVLANKRDVPYQSLLKVFLAERLEQERRGA